MEIGQPWAPFGFDSRLLQAQIATITGEFDEALRLVPDDGDPHFQALSEFVISQATADWRNFAAEYGRMTPPASLQLPTRRG